MTMPNKKNRLVQKKKKRTLEKAENKKTKRGRKTGGSKNLPEALGQFEDRMETIRTALWRGLT